MSEGLTEEAFVALVALASLILALFWLARAVDAARGGPTVPSLAELPPLGAAEAPAVSIVVAARNEGETVAAGVGSLLALDYPRYEVVAVDDRSTDSTGSILAAMAERDPRLRVLHVEGLPDGWLGKNRALALGAEGAAGEWILFADADVVIAPTALSRAVGYAAARHLDHLTVLPTVITRGLSLRLFTAYIAFLVAGTSRPWRVRDPKAHEAVGIGAFNLVRREAYLRSGGYAAIRLRPDDDMRLAQSVKRCGGHSDVALGRGLVSVEWQTSLGAALRAMEKTMFATLDYRFGTSLLGLAGLLVCGLSPFVGTALAAGWPRWPFALAAAISLVLFARAGQAITAFPWLAALALPLLHIFWAFSHLRATAAVLSRGGIVWRGTFYPLELLRGGRG